jgi:hypothetical protein
MPKGYTVVSDSDVGRVDTGQKFETRVVQEGSGSKFEDSHALIIAKIG